MRLSLALEQGLALPDGPVVVRHPVLDTDLAALPDAKIDSPDWFVAQRADRAGRLVDPDATGFAATVIVAPRSKDLARDLIAQAGRETPGMIVVDGQKTDGIDSLWKACRHKADVLGNVTKAHGRCFWMQCEPGAFDDWDWVAPDVHGLVTAPGVFSADGIDPGSYALAEVLPETLSGRVADLGAGWGYLSLVAQSRGADHVDLVDANAMAIACASENVDPEKAAFYWQDATTWSPEREPDHVIMNPPFHQGRKGTPDLGAAFIRNAAKILSARGTLWMVANRHLPYEPVLTEAFGEVTELEGPPGSQGFKLFKASRPQGRAKAKTVARTRR